MMREGSNPIPLTLPENQRIRVLERVKCLKPIPVTDPVRAIKIRSISKG